LLQATSPMTTRLISMRFWIKSKRIIWFGINCGQTHRFSWNANGSPQNYDVLNRPRRQDFEGLLIENGAVYATTKAALQSKTELVAVLV
jgi:N-acylneuraminate cytidylyltransferase